MILNATGGGKSGAILTVTGVPGSTMTAAKDGKSFSRTADSSGIAVFKGLESGEWTLTMTSGGEIATRTFAVTADYSITITFFSATINVTYPAGSVCSCSDGSNTLTAPDTSGTWACIVPNAGTWTVTATNGTNTKSATVEITSEGQSISITLNLLPETYQEVEYIQTTGTQYIDTGIIPIDSTYQVSTKISITTTQQDICVFGTNGASYYHLTPYVNKWCYGTNGAEGSAGTYNATVGNEHIIEFNNSFHGIIINGELIVSELTFINSSNSIKMSSRSDSRYGKFKYYYFRIINNQTNDILMDLIPCYRRSDSVAGMYDLVSGKFCINSGTGTFLVGGDIS